MGGKRPDQYAIDPGEAGATDYKSLRDEKIHEGDKQEFTTKQAELHHDSLIPRRGVNPALADLQARREQARRDEAGHDRPDDTPAGDGELPA